MYFGISRYLTSHTFINTPLATCLTYLYTHIKVDDAHLHVLASPTSYVPSGLVVRISRSHRDGRGSIPRLGISFTQHDFCHIENIVFLSYECFILRARRLSSKLLKQGYLVERLKSSFRKFYGRYGDLIEQYGVTLFRMLNDILTLDQQ